MIINQHTESKKGRKFFFNYQEIAFVGKPSLKKTELIKRIIECLSEKFKIGYVRTEPVKENDAYSIFVGNEGYYGNTTEKETDFILSRNLLFNSEIVFIDTNENSPVLAQIIFSENEADLKPEIWQKSKAIIFAEKQINNYPEIPCFSTNDLTGIAKFIGDFFLAEIKKIPLNGLILAGGRSIRMQKDKSSINYHGKAQSEHLFNLLEKYCQQVFLSVRKEQDIAEESNNLPKIYDLYQEIGPMSGILSAFKKDPDSAWLVIACDLPFVDKNTLEFLIEKRNPFSGATCFKSKEDGFPEPLCTIYEPKFGFRLQQFLGLGYDCPRKALINSKVEKIEQPGAKTLFNVNTPEEFEKVKKILNH